MSQVNGGLDTGAAPQPLTVGSDGSTAGQLPAAMPIAPTRALIAALELGILADYLMRANGLGANITLWCWALLITTVIVTRHSGVVMDRRRVALLAGAAFFAAVPAWRSGEMLVFFSGLAVLTLLVLSAWTASSPGLSLLNRRVGAYIRAAWTAFVHIVVGAAPLLAAEARARSDLRSAYRRPAGAIVRGLALSVPVVLVLGSLLVQADPAFESVVRKLLRWDTETIVSHLLLTGVFAWLASAYFCASVRWGGAASSGRTVLHLGAIEGAMVLGVVNLLFLSFMLVQTRYLFGGTEHVLATAGLTFAEYARRGFFELVGVTMLTLPLLVGITSMVQLESARERLTHRVLTATLVVLLLALLASAAGRMRLYQAEYGWTLPRVEAAVLMIWICTTIIWFAATVLRGRAERFTLGAIVAGLLLFGGMVVTNPAAMVVRANAARIADGKEFDAVHAAQLGNDGLPALLEALPVIAPTLDLRGRCSIQRTVDNARGVETAETAETAATAEIALDWRAWNLSRSRAKAAAERHAGAITRVLGTASCVELANSVQEARAAQPAAPPR